MYVRNCHYSAKRPISCNYTRKLNVPINIGLSNRQNRFLMLISLWYLLNETLTGVIYYCVESTATLKPIILSSISKTLWSIYLFCTSTRSF